MLILTHARVMNGSHSHSLHVNENLLYQLGHSVVPSVSPPTLLWQHTPHFCLICSLLLLFCPLLIFPHPLLYLLLLSFTAFNTSSAQKEKKDNYQR